jgi:hypothetical protein
MVTSSEITFVRATLLKDGGIDKFLRFPTRLRQLAVRFLGKAEIVGGLDGHFLGDVEDLDTLRWSNPKPLKPVTQHGDYRFLDRAWNRNVVKSRNVFPHQFGAQRGGEVA